MDVVVRAESERGELVLRRRAVDGALELRVNGVFVMDDRETSTETLLARRTLEARAATTDGAGAAGAWRVVVGGLGLGYTLAAVLDDDRVGSVLLAEIEPDLVRWHRDGLVAKSRISDPRVDVVVEDVRPVVAGLPAGSVDLILLDVDNGPDFLVYGANAAVYAAAFLADCRDALAPAGVVAVWSAETSPALSATLDAVFGSSRELALPVTLQTRLTTYHLFLAERSLP